ncbi:MAG: RNA 3'-terminal phosphate cyclase [bacterium]|nr:MAG: RNA 3'-terminal phosphate cyclase [bacterium]
MTEHIIHIDGSLGEGGGQVLRTATGLSSLLKIPVRVDNIRASRPRPGLAAQHMTGIKALCRLTGGTAEGLSVGSEEVIFRPGGGQKARLDIDVGTAGSVTLILQGLLVALARAPGRVRLTLRGGTDVGWSPPFHYFSRVLCPLLAQMGIPVKGRLIRTGFYPKGGGEVEVAVTAPGPLQPFRPASPPAAPAIRAFVVASEDLRKARVAERLLRGARSIFPEIKAEREYRSCLSTGCSIVVTASGGGAVLGADSLGEKGTRAEEVGARAAARLAEELASDVSVDEWASDQILPFLALAGGESSFLARTLTRHAETNMRIIERFLPARFRVQEVGGKVRVSCLPKG